MTWQLPDVDAPSFEELRSSALHEVVRVDPAWTDHNVSNPGTMMVELMAWLVDGLTYQSELVGDDARRAMLELLSGPSPTARTASVDDLEVDVLDDLARRHRIVTADDAVAVVSENFPAIDVIAALSGLAPTPLGLGNEPSACTLVVRAADVDEQLDVDTLNDVRNFIHQRRLVTAQMHVVGIRYHRIAVTGQVTPTSDATADMAIASAKRAVAQFLDERSGGREGTGWQVGREVDRLEISAAIDAAEHVDHVDGIDLRSLEDDRARLVPALSFDADELPLFLPEDAQNAITGV